MKIPQLDLRPLTRSSDRVSCIVLIKNDAGRTIPWIRMGEVSLRHHEYDNFHMLASRYTDGVTDFEHDSAWAIQLPIIGLTAPVSFDYSVMRFSGIIPPARSFARYFHVPKEAVSPSKIEGAQLCDRCGMKHWIVPRFVPEPNIQLNKMMEGEKIEFIISYIGSDEE